MSMKKQYVTPSLEVIGTVSQLTHEANKENADVPMGNPGTAYSPGISSH